MFSLRLLADMEDVFRLVYLFGGDSSQKDILYMDFAMGIDIKRCTIPDQTAKAVTGANFDSYLTLALSPPSIGVAKKSLWLELDTESSNPDWNSARINFLFRLNERRAVLERFHQCVLLVFPQNWTKIAAEAAPNLWTIRQPSLYITA